MRLKKLSIFGFKSFAEKVVLDFDSEIIGVVGPNGCGKSNIVDAFRWVMGEQSAKSLRGDKMHDILFAGSDHRKPVNYAEVSVTLSDVSSELPTPYEEVTITRRLYRSGESEYFINKESARLRDIQGLFLGTGIGKNAFSIFEQGKLDQIIHLSPVERRVIFDEAAGTSRFLQRKKETMKKLAAVSENYTRAHDVHAEIEKQAKQLKKQASHAKNYQENKNRLIELEKNLLLIRLKQTILKTVELEEQLRHLNVSIQEGLVVTHALDHQLDQGKKNVLAEELILKQQHKELNQYETKTRILETETTQQKNRLLEIKKREENVKAHLQELIKEQKNVQEELEKKGQLLKDVLLKKENAHHVFLEKKREHAAVENRVKILSEQVKKLQAERLDRVQEEGRAHADLQEKKFRYEAKETRLNKLTDLENKQQVSLQLCEETILSQNENVAALTSHIDTFKDEMDQLENRLQVTKKQIAEGKIQENALLRQITEAEGHKKALERLKEEMEGFSAGAKMLLKEAKNEKSSLFKKIEPLFEYFFPKKGYECLLAASMRAYAETLVVATEEDFVELIAFSKKRKITEFSVVVKERLNRNKTFQEKTLSDYLEANALAVHFADSVVIADDDHFFDGLGVYFFVGQGKKLNNAFHRQAELKSLSETLSVLHSQADSHAVSMHSLFESLKADEKRRSEISEVRRKKEMDLIQENFFLQRSLADFEKMKKEMLSLKHEKESLVVLEKEKIEIEILKEKALLLQAETDQLCGTLSKEESLLESAQIELSRTNQHVQFCDNLFQEAKDAWQKMHQDIEVLKAQQHQREALEKKLSLEIEDLRISVENTLNNILRFESDLAHHHLKLNTFQNSVKEQDKKLSALKKDLEKIEKELGIKRKAVSQVEKEQHSLEVVLAKELADRKGLEQELCERHSFSLDQLESAASLVQLNMSLDEAGNEISRLKISLESAGAINMAAIEEFQHTQERFDNLDRQLKDLEESKKDLEEVISKLDQESRKIFKKTFFQIRDNFQKNFATLFKGGSADLTFTESSDILEAGIEIVAKPPGKHMRSITLLSGGEKCLTALALLFSIFQVRPAPFCILDEVDAPLDDSNIERFTTVLKQFIDKTQFIVVTHNKKTMAIADILIGVSMEEKGVSKLISLAFEKIKINAPA